MAQGITVTVTADTADAAQKLQALSETVTQNLTRTKVAAEGAAASLAKNRIAYMELGHVARSSVEALAAGISPLRVLGFEAPRVVQAVGFLGIGLSTLVPILGGVGVAAGATYLAWHEFTKSTREAQKAAEDFQKAIAEIPKTLETLRISQESGLLSREAATQYRDYLTGKIPLYKTPQGGLTRTPSETISVPEQVNMPGAGVSMPTSTGRMVERTIAYQKASLSEVQEWVKQQVLAGHATEDVQKSMAELARLEKQVRAESRGDLEKEIAAIHDRYEKERQEILQNIAVAKAAGTLTPKKEAEALSLIDSTKRNEAFEIAKKEREGPLKAFEDGKAETARRAKEAQANLERQLTLEAAQQGGNRIDLFQKEFDRRKFLLDQQLYAGEIDEKTYTAELQEQLSKRLLGEKNFAAEKRRLADASLEFALGSVRAQVYGIESDPLLTRAQKAQQMLALYQQENQLLAENIALQQRRINDPTLSAEAHISAQRELVTLQQQQAELQQQQVALAGQDSFGFQFSTALVGLQDQWGSWAQQLATNFSDVFNSAISSISNGITNLIIGTKSWGQALQEIGTSILSTIIGAIVQMGVRWITTRILMATVGKTIEASMVAASAPIAAAASAIWAVPATLATIASYGGAAAAAPGLIALAEGITLATAAFADGGRPNVGEVALVGERGPELFVPDVAGTIIPAHETARIMEGGGGSRAGANIGAAAAPQVHVAVLNDRQDLQRFLEESAGENAIVRIVNRRRTDIGLDT